MDWYGMEVVGFYVTSVSGWSQKCERHLVLPRPVNIRGKRRYRARAPVANQAAATTAHQPSGTADGELRLNLCRKVRLAGPNNASPA
jgi:hypothetical protein